MSKNKTKDNNNKKVVQTIRDLHKTIMNHDKNLPQTDMIQVKLKDGKAMTIDGKIVENVMELYKTFEIDMNLLDEFSVSMIQQLKETNLSKDDEIDEDLIKRELIMQYANDGLLEYFLYLQFVQNNQFILDVSLETTMYYKMFIKTIISLLTTSVDESANILIHSLNFLMEHNATFYLNKIKILLNNLNSMIKNDRFDNIYSELKWNDIIN